MSEYIDREKLLRDIEHYHLSDGKFQHWIEIQPAADVVPVVRCKDCKYYKRCNLMTDDDFCSDGERKDDTSGN